MTFLKLTRTHVASLAMAASGALFALSAQAHHLDAQQTSLQQQLDTGANVVENAAKVPDLSTLVAALQAAGLDQTLAGPGPFTVFAPVNDAFAALPAGTLENLLKPENKDQLTAILLYHVLPQRYTVAELEQAAQAPTHAVQAATAQGGSLTVTDTQKGGHWTVTDAQGNTAKVLYKGLTTGNATVYVIDAVLLP